MLIVNFFIPLPLLILGSFPFYFSSFFYLKIRKNLDREKKITFLRSFMVFSKVLRKTSGLYTATNKNKLFSKKGKFMTAKYHLRKKF